VRLLPPKPQGLSINLEPSVVASVLREHRPRDKHSQVILHVTSYSTKLGQFVIEFTGRYLRNLPWRTSFPMLTLGACVDYCKTVSHVLHLIDSFRQDEPIESGSALPERDSVLSDRIALLIIHAALLTHCYAKTVTVKASHGLLEASKKDTVDSYITEQHYTSVLQARHAAEKGIDELAEKGYQLGKEVMHLV
jgi:hypothetical protein